MGDAKRIRVEPIDRKSADAAVKRWHYSGKVVNNSQLHLGAFLDGQLLGAMQFGPSLDKSKLQGLVEGTPWNGFIELNRMAFSDALPRNAESRCIAVAMRMFRRLAPHVQWVVSFADGAQCGDGTIYRASGFALTGIRRNTSLWAAPDGHVIADVTIKAGNPARREVFSRTSLTDNSSRQQQQQRATSIAREVFSRTSLTKADCPQQHAAQQRAVGAESGLSMANGGASMRAYKEAGFRPIPGFQLRYVYFIDPTARERLTVPVLPFSAIDAAGARMYRGKPSVCAGTSTRDGAPVVVGGATPTPALQS